MSPIRKKVYVPKWKGPKPTVALVDRRRLARYNSYDDPEFVKTGVYTDRPFTCHDCGKSQVWTAAQQKWWYEVARGQVYSTAIRCRSCRQKQREQAAESRKPATKRSNR